jgi:GH24 family phage-related lysozyme (muramidase)
MTGKDSMGASKESPNARMRMSPEALGRMRDTEKVVLKYYNDMGKNRGNCTFGPGLLAHKGVCSQEELARKVTADNVDIEYAKRVAETERLVRRKTKVALNQAQYDALVSLTYNAGLIATRTTYDCINKGDFKGAAERMSEIITVTVGSGKNKKTVIAPGLIRRRADESAAFRTPVVTAAASK